jgi:hypothetical protein
MAGNIRAALAHSCTAQLTDPPAIWQLLHVWPLCCKVWVHHLAHVGHKVYLLTAEAGLHNRLLGYGGCCCAAGGVGTTAAAGRCDWGLRIHRLVDLQSYSAGGNEQLAVWSS